jgi:hypothetical protein
MGFSGLSVYGLIFVLLIYVIPSFIALKLDHKDKAWIIFINIFGGIFFGAGWLVALVWCFSEKLRKVNL